MTHTPRALLLLIPLIILTGCSNTQTIKREAITNVTKLSDKTFPIFDAHKPDTIYNKKRFQEYLEIEPTEKVKNIYTYGDFLGADYKVLISFTTDQETIATIVKIKNMNLSEVETDDGLGFTEEITWWDRDKIESLRPYKIGKEDEYWKYLWYDTKTNQAFYEEFSL